MHCRTSNSERWPISVWYMNSSNVGTHSGTHKVVFFIYQSRQFPKYRQGSFVSGSSVMSHMSAHAYHTKLGKRLNITRVYPWILRHQRAYSTRGIMWLADQPCLPNSPWAMISMLRLRAIRFGDTLWKQVFFKQFLNLHYWAECLYSTWTWFLLIADARCKSRIMMGWVFIGSIQIHCEQVKAAQTCDT